MTGERVGAFEAELGVFREESGVPAVVAAVTDAVEVEDVGVAGSRSRTDPTPATVDDAWHLGSCGKSITALTFACLAEGGAAAWGTPVVELFPDLDGIDSGWAAVTVDDLLRCRAGVRANPTRAEMVAAHASDDLADVQRSELADRLLRSPPTEPGRFVYSNLSYVLVGAAIDRCAGRSYEATVERCVFDPLGVTSVGTGPPPLVRGHPARLRIGPGLGKGRPDGDGPGDNPLLLSPAGRFHMSIGDWAKIVRVFLAAGEPLIDRSSVERLLADPGDRERGRSMSMGWVSGEGVQVDHAMQGSNTLWVATALLDMTARRAALVVTNDGRRSVLRSSAFLAKRLLDRCS